MPDNNDNTSHPISATACMLCQRNVAEMHSSQFIRCMKCANFICVNCVTPETNWKCNCNRNYCKDCKESMQIICSECDHVGCKKCMIECSSGCGAWVCKACAHICHGCGSYYCPNCVSEQDCGHDACEECIHSCCECGNTMCRSCARNCHSSGDCYCTECSFECIRCGYVYSTALQSECSEPMCESCYESELEEQEREQEREASRREREANSRKYQSEDSPNDLTGSFSVTPEVRPKYESLTRIPWDSTAIFSTLAYSTSPSNWKFSKKMWEPSLYMGMEWELNYPSDSEIKVKTAVESVLHGKYIWKRDGSLTSGSELVLAPMTIQSFRDINLHDLCLELKKHGARGYDSGECGIHVHVSMEAISPDTMRKIMAWFMVNRKFVRRFSKRTISSINTWAKIPYNLKIWFEGYTDDVHSEYNRHIAINRTDKTWEFRVFRSTVRYERIKATLHFVDAIIEFAKLHSFVVCSGPDGFSAFMRYILKNPTHDYLYNYLACEPGLYLTKEAPSKDVQFLISEADYQPELNC